MVSQSRICHNIIFYRLSSIMRVYCDKTAGAKITEFSLNSSQMSQLSAHKFDDKIGGRKLGWGAFRLYGVISFLQGQGQDLAIRGQGQDERQGLNSLNSVYMLSWPEKN